MRSRKTLRLRRFDYRRAGAYFVTLCGAGTSRAERGRFGSIRVVDSRDAQPTFVPNDVGEIVTDCWIDIPGHFSTVMIDEFVLLPDHFHGIVFIGNQNSGAAFGFAPPGWMRAATTQPDDIGELPDPLMPDVAVPAGDEPSRSVIIGSFKSAVSRQSASARSPGRLWQRGFHERIIRDQVELDAYRKYIATNVRRHAIVIA